jgi:O-antigen ligase
MAPIRPALIVGLFTFLVFIVTKPTSVSDMSINNGQVKLYAVLVGIMMLSIPFALYRKGAFMFLFTHYINVILFFFIFYKIVDSPKKLMNVLFLACLGTGLYSASALIEGGFVSQRLYFGGMFDPNDLAFFSLSFLPFNLIFLSRDNKFLRRFICMCTFVLGILLILVTGSRGGIVAFLVVTLMLLFKRTDTFKLSYKFVFVGLILIAVFAKVVTINLERYASIGDLKNDYNITSETGRLEVWKTGLQLMLARPLTGVGINCIGEAMGTYREDKGLIPRWQTAHNSLIQIGVETGIVGFILFALISFKAFRIFGKLREKTDSKELIKIAEMARVGFIGHFITVMFLSQAYSVYWAFYIVLSAVLFDLSAKEGKLESKPKDSLF